VIVIWIYYQDKSVFVNASTIKIFPVFAMTQYFSKGKAYLGEKGTTLSILVQIPGVVISRGVTRLGLEGTSGPLAFNRKTTQLGKLLGRRL